jgi:hypothetical protein
MYEPAAGAALRPWRKILYEKQPFEDDDLCKRHPKTSALSHFSTEN